MSAAEKALTIATSLMKWDYELTSLTLLPTLTKAQKNRAADLRSATDTFEVYLEDGAFGPVPTHAWIQRANLAFN